MTGALFARLRAAAPRGLAVPTALLDEVAAAYGSPGRHYHTLEHVAEVAERFAEVADGTDRGWRDPVSVYAALLAHDAVYDVARTDNEAASAEIGRVWCRALGADADRCAALIEATATHGTPLAGEVPADDSDLALFLDCDLAILGAPPARYDRYERDVALEYAAVYDAAAYRIGRARFLASMLAGERVFHTDRFEGRLGAAARSNLGRALGVLSI